MAFPVSRRSGDDVSGSSSTGSAFRVGAAAPRPEEGLNPDILEHVRPGILKSLLLGLVSRGLGRSSEPRSLGAVKEASSSAARIDGAGRLPQSAKGDGAPVRTGFGDATSLLRGSAAIAGVRRGSTRSFVNHVSRVGAVTVSARSRGEKRVTQLVILLARVVSALCGSAAASKLDGVNSPCGCRREEQSIGLWGSSRRLGKRTMRPLPEKEARSPAKAPRAEQRRRA